jgi:hypothetical protein
MNNLADSVDFTAKKKQLFDDLLKMQKSMDDELDLMPLYKTVIN